MSIKIHLVCHLSTFEELILGYKNLTPVAHTVRQHEFE